MQSQAIQAPVSFIAIVSARQSAARILHLFFFQSFFQSNEPDRWMTLELLQHCTVSRGIGGNAEYELSTRTHP